MEIMIKTDETKHYPNLRSSYRSISVTVNGKLDLSVVIVTPDMFSDSRAYCAVIVENAAHRAWRGLGKEFPSLDAALKNYRDRKVVAGLEHIKGMVA